MGTSIELWTYRLFQNDTVFLEEVFQKATSASASAELKPAKDLKMVAAGKKAAETRAMQTFTLEEHFEGMPEHLQELGRAIGDFILRLDPSIEQAPKKTYIAYKAAQNVVCMEIQKAKILLFLKLDPKVHSGPKDISRDVSAIGHFGAGDLEVTTKEEAVFKPRQ